jgi:membrane fusion protein, multidrug efflux system
VVKTLKGVIVVPTASVQRGPTGTFLYVMDDNGTAQLRPVTVGQQDDQQAVIETGLKLGEKVITTGFARLSDGAKVEVAAPDATGAPLVDDKTPPAAASGEAQPANATTGEGNGKRRHKDGAGGQHRRQNGGNAAEGGQSGSTGTSGNSTSPPAP